MQDISGDDFDLQVLTELSHARSNPAAVAESVRSRLQHFKGKEYYPPDRGGKTAVITKEGEAALRDTLQYLEKQSKLKPLGDFLPQGMRLAADDHLHDLGTRGATGHQGADGSSSSERQQRYGKWKGTCGECLWFGRMGSTAKQIVEDLIIDDGVPSRGHRLGIYNTQYEVAGVRMGVHKTFGACCVIEFAAGYEDDTEQISRRVAKGPPPVAAGKEPVTTQWRNLGECPGCKEPIHGGAVIEALGKKWHRDCFACQGEGCGTGLQGVPYQENGGLPYCKSCYTQKFGSTCHGCGEKIQGGVLKAAGHTWHKECFSCSSCKGALQAKFVVREGKPLCADCSGATGGASPARALASKAPPASRAGPNATSTAAAPHAAKAGARLRTPPKAASKASAKAGSARTSTALVGAGGALMKAAPKPAPKKSSGSAKKAVDDIISDYASLL